MRRNLVLNPSFEVNLNGWTTNAGGALSQVPDGVGGGSAIRVERTGAAAAQYLRTVGTMIPASEGDALTVSAHIRSVTGLGAPGGLGVRWMNSSGTTVVGTDAANSFTATGDWQQMARVLNPAPAGTFYAQIQLSVQSMDTGESVDFDRVLIEEAGELLGYFDGDTFDPATPAWKEAWEGAEHYSVSTLTPPPDVVTVGARNEYVDYRDPVDAEGVDGEVWHNRLGGSFVKYLGRWVKVAG